MGSNDAGFVVPDGSGYAICRVSAGEDLSLGVFEDV